MLRSRWVGIHVDNTTAMNLNCNNLIGVFFVQLLLGFAFLSKYLQVRHFYFLVMQYIYIYIYGEQGCSIFFVI